MADYVPEEDIALWPLEERHHLCPFTTHWLTSAAVLLCANCFAPPPFGNDLNRPIREHAPCCKKPRLAQNLRFEQGRWRVQCRSCGATQTGSHLLAEHGRWESPSLPLKHDELAGVRGPEWMFEEPLRIVGVSTHAVSFETPSGKRLSINVDLPGRPLLGDCHPYLVMYRLSAEQESLEFLPDRETRARFREAIDSGLRWRIAQAKRDDGCALGVRGVINIATRVFECL